MKLQIQTDGIKASGTKGEVSTYLSMIARMHGRMTLKEYVEMMQRVD